MKKKSTKMLKTEGLFIEENNKKMQEDPAIDHLRESAFWEMKSFIMIHCLL